MSNLDLDSTSCSTVAFAELPAMLATDFGKSPEQLGPYKIIREIGRGAMGTVYEAIHEQLGRRVAVKVLPAELATSPKRLKRFRREMAAIGRLDHPNIVLATDAGEIDGICFIAMQYVDGQDLEQILDEIGRFEPADACEIIRQAALGLEHIGQQQLVHRDMKPSNILLTRRGEAKILDLGIAMLRNANHLDTSMTVVGAMMGTPDYIAPEQITECGEVDIRADIYSLGCTLYCLLSGRSPFNGPGYTTLTAKLLAHASKTPPSLAEAHAEIPKGIIDLVDRMMAKHADDRPATPGEVARLLTPFCKSADLLPVATGQRKSVRAEPLNLPPTSEGEATVSAGATIEADAVVPVTVESSIGKQKMIWGGAAAVAALAGAFWLNSPQPVVKPAIATLEQTLEPNVASNARLAKSVERTRAMIADVNHSIARSNETFASSTEQLALTLSEMQKQFAQRQSTAGSSSVVIENPQTPADHYYNAYLYGKLGNQTSARKAYMDYFTNELPVVDPHLQFIRLLKIQEGVAGARAVYETMPGNRDFVGRKLALAMLETGDQRRESLELLVADQPDFAPAVFLLSQQFSPEINPRVTLSEQRLQGELLHQFVSLHEQGQLLKHFLDPGIPAGLLETAENRLNKMKTLDSGNELPVWLVSVLPSGNQWRIGLGLEENAEDIYWALGEDGDFKKINRLPNAHARGNRAGKSKSNSFFQVSRRQVKEASTESGLVIRVKYSDADGQVQGPFSLGFDPAEEEYCYQRRLLEVKRGGWARFRDDKLRFNVLMMTGKNILASIRYGLNTETPEVDFPVPQGASANRMADFEVPVVPDETFVTIQLIYTDGTTSEIVRIDREDEPEFRGR